MERRSAASGSCVLTRQKDVGDESVSEAPRPTSSPELAAMGCLGCSVPVAVRDRLDRPFSVRAVEAACRVAVARGDVPGVQLSADPVYRSMVNVGSVPAVPADSSGSGQAHRPLLPSGRRGGLVVVVAAPRGAMRKEMKDIKHLVRAGWNAGPGLMQRPGEAGDGQGVESRARGQASRQRDGRAALPDARVRDSKTER